MNHRTENLSTSAAMWSPPLPPHLEAHHMASNSRPASLRLESCPCACSPSESPLTVQVLPPLIVTLAILEEDLHLLVPERLLALVHHSLQPRPVPPPRHDVVVKLGPVLGQLFEASLRGAEPSHASRGQNRSQCGVLSSNSRLSTSHCLRNGGPLLWVGAVPFTPG